LYRYNAVMGVTGDAGGGAAGPVTAVWRVEADADAARAAPPPPAPLVLYTPVDAASEDAVVAALTKISGDAATDAVPTLQVGLELCWQYY
jgi:hypothetical protein